MMTRHILIQIYSLWGLVLLAVRESHTLRTVSFVSAGRRMLMTCTSGSPITLSNIQASSELPVSIFFSTPARISRGCASFLLIIGVGSVSLVHCKQTMRVCLLGKDD